MIEEGFNESMENEAFLKKLDLIESQLDKFAEKLAVVKKDTFKKLDDLSSKMTSQHSVQVLSDYFHKKIAENKFDKTLQTFVDKREKDLDEAKALRSQL